MADVVPLYLVLKAKRLPDITIWNDAEKPTNSKFRSPLYTVKVTVPIF